MMNFAEKFLTQNQVVKQKQICSQLTQPKLTLNSTDFCSGRIRLEKDGSREKSAKVFWVFQSDCSDNAVKLRMTEPLKNLNKTVPISHRNPITSIQHETHHQVHNSKHYLNKHRNRFGIYVSFVLFRNPLVQQFVLGPCVFGETGTEPKNTVLDEEFEVHMNMSNDANISVWFNLSEMW
jgi:hypothetical protein